MNRSGAETGVAIKGTREGITVTLGGGKAKDLLKELEEHLQRGASFFQGAEVTVHINQTQPTTDDLLAIQEVFEREGIAIRAIATKDPTTKLLAEQAGFTTVHPIEEQERVRPEPSFEMPSEEALLIRRTLRSGQTVRFPGHVVVVGDVNPGAEIVAGGDVVVWGRVRGMVHAGAMGDEQAIVCALQLQPTQLGIADKITRSPEEEFDSSLTVEVARIQEGRIVVDTGK
ncbi:MAG: septum site-determining protein MinC [Anaerolineae bacterium]